MAILGGFFVILYRFLILYKFNFKLSVIIGPAKAEQWCTNILKKENKYYKINLHIYLLFLVSSSLHSQQLGISCEQFADNPDYCPKSKCLLIFVML